MCYSAEVSFGSAVVLASIGSWCLNRTLRAASWFWPFAIIPCLFGIQQGCEGLVWVGLKHNSPELARVASVAYLFFALAFWPIWFCVATWLVEPNRALRKFLGAWALLSTAWFFFCFVPLLTGMGSLSSHPLHHSIRYEYPDTGALWHGLAGVWGHRFLYIMTATVPAVTTSIRRLIWIQVVAGILCALVAALLFDYAFTSVWCLFSALFSITLIHSISTACHGTRLQST